MNVETSGPSVRKKQILFLFPLIYRPEKYNISKRFTLLSRWFGGHIFALSGGKQRGIPVGGFLFHSERFGNSAAIRFFRGIWIQVMVPLWLLWGKTQVSAVIAYDPYRSGLAALILKYALHCKMIVEINGDYHRMEPRRDVARKIIMRSLFKLVLRSADAIKVLNSDQELFCRRFLVHKTIYRFPSFVACEYFESLESYQGDYLLSVGHPFDLKGMDVLISAFKLIADKYPRIGLRIMGYCPQPDLNKYQALASGYSQIVFVEPGWIEEVGTQLRGCYGVVNAARSEALGRVQIEAMACGKPIISTRTNGALECIEDGRTGLLCAIDDVEDLAGKLVELLSNPNRAAQMGLAGKIRMQKLFSERAYAENFHSMLEEVTESPATVS